MVFFEGIMRWVVPAAALAALVSFFAAFTVRALAKKAKVLRYPGSRHLHAKPTPLWGGIAIAAVFLAGIALHPDLVLTPAIIAAAIGFFLLVIMGMVDDVISLPWWVEFFGQGLAAAIVVAGGGSL